MGGSMDLVPRVCMDVSCCSGGNPCSSGFCRRSLIWWSSAVYAR